MSKKPKNLKELETITANAGYDRRTYSSVKRFDEIPVVPNLDKKILKKIEQDPRSFNMTWWHYSETEALRCNGENKCGTTHCRAGWAIALAGDAGYKLEARLGPGVAGALIYAKSTGYIPPFHSSEECAIADMQIRAGLKKA